METLLWAVEEVSGIFGLKLNRKKCNQISIRETRPIKFKNGEELQIVNTTEYLGSLFNKEANPRIEIKSRLNKAARCRHRMKEFWTRGKLNKLEKVLIYEALICAKMTYALEVLPIPQTEYERVDAEYLRGYRQIFGLKTTYAQKIDGEEMTNTNERVIELVNEALSETRKQRKYCPISKIIKRRAEKRFGQSLRKHWSDPIGQVVRGFHRTRAKPWNFTYKGECLPWRPKTNWIVDTARRIWDDYQHSTKI